MRYLTVWPVSDSALRNDLGLSISQRERMKMANGGNAHDRRITRRILQRVLETYGYQSKSAPTIEKTQSFEEFLVKYVAVATGFAGLGYEVRELSPTLASALYLLSLGVFLRGLWPWCTTRKRTRAVGVFALLATLAFLCFDGNWMRAEWTPNFLCVVPSHELVDCERRAFFVNHVGLKDLQNVRIVVKDNRSGTIVDTGDIKTTIEPGPQDSDAPLYFWVTPSRPWDESYTVTVIATKFHSVQETVLRSDGQNLNVATRITVAPSNRVVATCRDPGLPEAYPLARESRNSCGALMSIDAAVLNRLKPEPNTLQTPNGGLELLTPKTLPPASEMDSQSEDRHLSEYGQTIMKAKLSKYRGTRVLILDTGGQKTSAYAMQFRNLFSSMHWRVDGPRLVPPGDEGIVDVAISVGAPHWVTPYPPASDLLSSLEGTKHRHNISIDNAIQSDLIVLWVGPKSPDNFSPDDCAPPAMHPRPGEPHTCAFVRQAATCPIIPK
jgi:hypothetical protein